MIVDDAEAHRQVPVDRRDWHLLGCRVEAGGVVFIGAVGTFGIASAHALQHRLDGLLTWWLMISTSKLVIIEPH